MEKVKFVTYGAICDCSCHTSNGFTMHCVPCCYLCSYCGQRMPRDYFDEHKKTCNMSYMGSDRMKRGDRKRG